MSSSRAAASACGCDRVCDLVPPGQRAAVIAVAFAGGFDERDPGVVDGERVRAQGARGLRGVRSGAGGARCACRRPGWSSAPWLGEDTTARAAVAPWHGRRAPRSKSGARMRLGPAQRRRGVCSACIWRGGEQPVLVQALHHLDRDGRAARRARRRGRSLMARSLSGCGELRHLPSAPARSSPCGARLLVCRWLVVEVLLDARVEGVERLRSSRRRSSARMPCRSWAGSRGPARGCAASASCSVTARSWKRNGRVSWPWWVTCARNV